MTKQTQKITNEEKFEVPTKATSEVWAEYNDYWCDTDIAKMDTNKIIGLIGDVIPPMYLKMLKDAKAFRKQTEKECDINFYMPIKKIIKPAKVKASKPTITLEAPKVEVIPKPDKAVKPVKASKVASKATLKPDKVKASKLVKPKVEMF